MQPLILTIHFFSNNIFTTTFACVDCNTDTVMWWPGWGKRSATRVSRLFDIEKRRGVTPSWNKQPVAPTYTELYIEHCRKFVTDFDTQVKFWLRCYRYISDLSSCMDGQVLCQGDRKGWYPAGWFCSPLPSWVRRIRRPRTLLGLL